MEFDWLKYRKVTVVKIIFTVILTVLPILLVLSLIPLYAKTFGEELHTKVIGVILLIVIETELVFRLSCYIRIETSEKYAERYYIKTHDERIQFIEMHSSALALKLSMYVVGICDVIAGCFDSKTFFTLLLVFVGQVVLYFIAHQYYKYKN